MLYVTCSTEIENKISDITVEFNKIKEHASDLQIFLSLPHLISKANDEEKEVEKLGRDGKLSSTVLFILPINVSCSLSRWVFTDFRIL
jgi:hypothetical protein